MSKLDFLIERCKSLGRITAAIVDPRSDVALTGALTSYEHGILNPVLVGPKAEIKKIAKENNINIERLKIVDAENEIEAAAKSAQLASTGEVHCLVKGSLHTDIMMHAVLQPEYNLRTTNLISSCGLLDVPSYNRLIFLTDMVMNILPTLDQKVHIINNAVEMAIALGWSMPKVSIVSAVETINPKIQTTLDAAVLSKMADRGQIKNCVIDGPIDLDISISPQSAKTKHFKSQIMGNADILLLPDLEAANIMYKTLVFMANATAADVILGAKIPIVVTSRSDDEKTRLLSDAAAALIAHSKVKA
ncbi:MAG: bifunctional enoyl-CoA hydratase/phosphate acetyltransferase [Rickettsiales bacterium]|nr:bifunctional enoyl-CoA hydratase/phosphate acetyltransferase [Rickettsiales bacterium]